MISSRTVVTCTVLFSLVFLSGCGLLYVTTASHARCMNRGQHVVGSQFTYWTPARARWRKVRSQSSLVVGEQCRSRDRSRSITCSGSPLIQRPDSALWYGEVCDSSIPQDTTGSRCPLEHRAWRVTRSGRGPPFPFPVDDRTSRDAVVRHGVTAGRRHEYDARLADDSRSENGIVVLVQRADFGHQGLVCSW